MKPLAIFLIAFFALCYLSISLYLLWKHRIKPENDRNEADYEKLYKTIQSLLADNPTGTKALEEIRLMIAVLENLKFKNKEKTEIIFLQYVKLRYGMSKDDMLNAMHPRFNSK